MENLKELIFAAFGVIVFVIVVLLSVQIIKYFFDL
jgi:hypothetical protein